MQMLAPTCPKCAVLTYDDDVAVIQMLLASLNIQHIPLRPAQDGDHAVVRHLAWSCISSHAPTPVTCAE